MRNVLIAAMMVAAGASSSYIARPSGSESATGTAERGKIPTIEGKLPQPIDDPMDLLKDFLGFCEDSIDRLRELKDLNRQPCAAQEVKDQGKEAHGPNCTASREFKDLPLNLNFIIATIPDPERTHLGLSFDRALEAIINAAEDEGFGYDRYWLPWHANHDQANPDPRKQDILDGRMESRHRKPGVIIFRNRRILRDQNQPIMAEKDLQTAKSFDLRESRNGALAIFLVGETPTSGVNRSQFWQSTQYIKSFAGCSYAMGVLGPTFSGSSTSLRAALERDFPREAGGRMVISGSVSGLDALSAVGTSTVHTDVFLSQALESLLKNQLRLNGGVAYLREAATDFGVIVSPSKRPTNDISYPREISRLRNVYPDQINPADAQVASLQQQLSLRLRDSRGGEETLPEFSDQTPVTQETVLLQISETLRRDHVGLVVVTGTDVLDVLFLTRHLRRMSPDVRLLIEGTDLLFIHGSDTLDFSGTLALSTYPLIPANQHWSNRGLPYSYFASNIAEGIYNACLVILNDPEHAPYVREYLAPTVSPPKNPGNLTWPPVWLSVIGSDSYWPLGFLSGTDQKSDGLMLGVPASGLPSLEPGRPTRAWSSIFYSCSLLAFAFIGIYFFVVRQPLNCIPRWCSFLHPQPYTAAPWRSGYFFLLTLSLMFAYLSFLIPVFRLALTNYHPEWMVMLAVGLTVLIGFLVISARTITQPRIMIALAVVATVATIYLLNFRRGSVLSEESFFRALRSVQIGSGVGPALPLFFLFLGLGWWASIQIQRARLVAEQLPAVPAMAANGAAMNIQRLNRWLEQPFLTIDRFGWVVAAVGAMVAAAIAIPHIISVDGVLFDAAVCALLIPLSTSLFLTTYAFGRIWRSLSRLLEALETQPIRFAFSNLPSDVSWSPLWQHGARRKTYATLIHSIESLRALDDAEPDYYPGLAEDIPRLDTQIAYILAPVSQGIEEPVEESNETQEFLAEIAQKLSDVPRTKDWKTNHSESLEKLRKGSGCATVHRGTASWLHPGKPAELQITSAPEDSEPKDTPEMLAAEIIALRYLAYIRYVVRHLRNLLSFITTGFILLTLAVNSYPFQTLNLIRWSITGIFVLDGAVVVYVFMEMSRNEILSRITDTKAGSLDMGFYTRMVSVGALPVLAVIASHFPSIGRFLFSWVQPAIAALH